MTGLLLKVRRGLCGVDIRSLWNSAVPGEERIPITFMSSQRWLLFVQGLSQKQEWSKEGDFCGLTVIFYHLLREADHLRM